jgi:uncharacterized protein with PQ loop repeat
MSLMSIEFITNFLGWSLALVAILTAWPQSFRLLRTGVATGVDPRTAALALLTMIAWAGYTINLTDIPAFVSSVGPLLAWLTTLITLVLFRVDGALRSLTLAGVLACALIFMAFTPAWSILGGIAALGSACWALPQLRTAFTVNRIDGVSIASYIAMAVENVGWILYAILTSTPAYAVGASIQAPATALIAWKALGSRPRSSLNANLQKIVSIS